MSVIQKVAQVIHEADDRKPKRRIEVGGGILRWEPVPFEELTPDQAEPYRSLAEDVYETVLAEQVAQNSAGAS